VVLASSHGGLRLKQDEKNYAHVYIKYMYSFRGKARIYPLPRLKLLLG
jgi:hypothetical protein